MFIYEKNGKLNIMVASNLPAEDGETADIVVEPVSGTPITAKVTINNESVAVGSGFTPVPAGTDVSTVAKLTDALKTAGIILTE